MPIESRRAYRGAVLGVHRVGERLPRERRRNTRDREQSAAVVAR
ncbi:hypothetical protein ACFOLD_09780 [Kocuria carniphila]